MNMDYCKFENTAQDLRQCLDGWMPGECPDCDGECDCMLDAGMNEYEAAARNRIFEMALEIVQMYADVDAAEARRAYAEEAQNYGMVPA